MADGGGGGRVGIGQDVTGYRHAVRRGPAPVPGGPEHLQPAAADPGAAARRGPDRAPSSCAGLAAAPSHPWAAQHGRHHVGGAQRAASDDVAAGFASLPERSPGRAVDCQHGHGDGLPRVRGSFRASQRRIVRVQLVRRLPGLPGPGSSVRSRRQHPGSRSVQDDRRGCGAAVEFRWTSPVDVRRRRARRPPGRAVREPERARARHRSARGAGSTAGNAAAAGTEGPYNSTSTTTTPSPQ